MNVILNFLLNFIIIVLIGFTVAQKRAKACAWSLFGRYIIKPFAQKMISADIFGLEDIVGTKKSLSLKLSKIGFAMCG